MRILYVAMKHDYGDPKAGFSFEQTVPDGFRVIKSPFGNLCDRCSRACGDNHAVWRRRGGSGEPEGLANESVYTGKTVPQ